MYDILIYVLKAWTQKQDIVTFSIKIFTAYKLCSLYY